MDLTKSNPSGVSKLSKPSSDVPKPGDSLPAVDTKPSASLPSSGDTKPSASLPSSGDSKISKPSAPGVSKPSDTLPDGGVASGRDDFWRQDYEVSLPVSTSGGVTVGGHVGPITGSDGYYVISFPYNRRMVIPGNQRLSVTGVDYLLVEEGGELSEVRITASTEMAFPGGGFIGVKDGGFIHINGCPRFYPPSTCKISVPINVSVQLYVGEDSSDDDEAGVDENWENVLQAFKTPVTDEDVAPPATDGCGAFKHVFGYEMAGPYTFTLGDGSVITSSSADKTVCLLGARSLSREYDSPEDVTSFGGAVDFGLGGSVIMGERSTISIPETFLLKAESGCLVEVPYGGNAELVTKIEDMHL